MYIYIYIYIYIRIHIVLLERVICPDCAVPVFDYPPPSSQTKGWMLPWLFECSESCNGEMGTRPKFETNT